MRVSQTSFLLSLHSNASHNLCGKNRQAGIVIPKKGWVHTPNIRGSSMATNKQPQHNPFPGTDAEIACSATGTACLFESAANPGAAAGLGQARAVGAPAFNELPPQPVWTFNGITPSPLIKSDTENWVTPAPVQYYCDCATACQKTTEASACHPLLPTWTTAKLHSKAMASRASSWNAASYDHHCPNVYVH